MPKTRADEILESAGAERQGVADAEIRAFVGGSAALEAPWISTAIAPFRTWLGLPAESRHTVRPGLELFVKLLGYGESGAHALLNAYSASGLGLEVEAGKQTWTALAHVARLARGAGIITWSLDTWKPSTDVWSKFIVTLEPPLHDRLRDAAAASKQPMASIVRAAIEESVARLERSQSAKPRAAATA